MIDEFEKVENVKEQTEKIETQYSPPEEAEARWIFDYSRLYWEIKARLMGGWIIEDKHRNYQIVRPKGANPLLNTTGVEETMALVNGFITKIQALTILDEERIFALCRDLYIKLSKVYYIQMENFDIDPVRASVVLRVVMNLFESNLRKSIAGRSLIMIGQTERIVETVQQPARKKIFGVI